MCCEADWKREVVQDYKWEYVDVKEFHDNGFTTRIKYAFVYIFLLKTVAIYGLDIFTAVTMLATDNWTNNLYTKCEREGRHCLIDVQFGIAKWVFVGCIIFSFLLLGYEWYKARAVIRSRDISYTFTNVMANDYYSIKSYDNFCLFCRISQNRQGKDKIAFFVFFTFKTWKRTILADGPRQSINGIILFLIAKAYNFDTSDISQYWDGQPWTALLLISMILTVLLFLAALIQLIVAAILYVPLLCYIQGNLKEYVCHKVDKRIGEIIRKSQKQRIQRNAEIEKKIQAGGKIKNSKGELVDASLLKPTLPQINLDEPLVMRSSSPALDRSASPAFGGRPVSPGFGRSASPAVGHQPCTQRTASPAFGRSASPALGRKPSGRDYPDSNGAYDDIIDDYGDSQHSYPPRPYDDGEYSSSSTSLVAHAAPPARAGAPRPSRAAYAAAQIARPSTPAGAPDFPPTTQQYAGAPDFPPAPAAVYGAPDFPPAAPSYPPLASHGPQFQQFDTVRQQQHPWGHPPDQYEWR